MKKSTLYGIVIGLASIFGAFLLEGGDFKSLFLLPPMIIVIGGTLAAGLASTSWAIFKRMFRLISISMNPAENDKKATILQILTLATVARRMGLLAVEGELSNTKTHPYLSKMFQVSIDGADSDTLTQIHETEMANITERHSENIHLFNKFGGYSPTMGIIGTVMGLISTMAAAGNDPNELIRHIAIAFLATLWGIVFANLVWLPIADKLQLLHNDEVYIYNIIFEGVKAVELGESPVVISTRLASFFPQSEQDAFLKEAKAVIDRQKQILQPSQGEATPSEN